MRAVLRVSILAAAAFAAAASSSSSSNQPPPQDPAMMGAGEEGPPASQPMTPPSAHGLWKSNFGPVKIVGDDANGQQAVMGVWVYDRNGMEVIGSFEGLLDGNVLTFNWEEPGVNAPLEGEGYLVFDPRGQSFGGKWWTSSRDRGGDWNGWRGGSAPPAPAPAQPDPYNDGSYGGDPYGGSAGGDPYSPRP